MLFIPWGELKEGSYPGITLIPDGAVVGVDLHTGDSAEVLPVLQQVNIRLTQQVEPRRVIHTLGGGGGSRWGIYIYTVYMCAKYSDFLCIWLNKLDFLTGNKVLAGSGSEMIYSGSGSCKKFRIRPDPDPDPQHWLICILVTVPRYSGSFSRSTFASPSR
jgi:hypothetical protein